jgi:hypothetical protein
MQCTGGISRWLHGVNHFISIYPEQFQAKYKQEGFLFCIVANGCVNIEL